MTFKFTFKKVILFLFLPAFIFIFWQSYSAITFRPFTSSINLNSNQIKGAYHLHTIYSDGIRPPDEIAKRASRAGLDFIIITDHGGANFKSLANQGWRKGVLVIAGSEVTVREGHFVALGFELPKTEFLPIAKLAMRQVKELGGFSIVAHPYNLKIPWFKWPSKGFIGIEIINGDSLFRKDFLTSFPYLFTFLINPQYALLKMTDYPEDNLKKWDELNLKRRVFGIFALDAHLFYNALFKFLNLYLLIEKPLPSNFEKAKEEVLNTLREGKFYNAIEGVARADGFKFWAKRGNQKIQMGEMKRLRFPVNLKIVAPFSFSTETRLIRNGKLILESTRKEINFRVKRPGVYRVEVFLRESSPLSSRIPWIISNPIFLRKLKEEKGE
ncbi:MAG: PHP domain-containing protein [Candidatus Aminicenantia bacterium]